jgi:Trypsin
MAVNANFGGAYIDQLHGGQLVVQAVNPTPAESAEVTNSAVGQHATILPVAHSWTDLEGARVKLTGELGSAADVETDVLNNRVTVSLLRTAAAIRTDSPGNALAPMNTGAAQSLVTAAGPMAVMIAPHDAEIPSSCITDACTPPLRGGLVMQFTSPGTTPTYVGSPFCTVGYNVVSRTDSKPYVLSAGHCAADFTGLIPFSYIAPPHSSPLQVGTFWSSAGNSTTGDDGAIWKLTNAATWVPAPYVLVHAGSQPDGPSTLNETFGLTRPTLPTNCVSSNPATCSDYPLFGIYVCQTGSSTGTHCGLTTDGFPRTHFTALNCQGDSGGPVFRYYNQYDDTAMGIVSSYPSQSGSQTSNFNPTTVTCGSQTTSVWIETLLSDLNVNLIYVN